MENNLPVVNMRYLIVGFGNIGKKRAFSLGRKFSVSFDPNSSAKADYQSLEDIPKDIYDTAVLTVPQQFKFELTKHFLHLSKNVLNEKPFILTKSQQNEISEISKKNKVTYFTSYNHRFEPNIKKITKLISARKLGKFYFGRMIYSFGNIKERIGTWRETEFGVLEEIAPHLIDLAMSWFGYQGKDFQTFVSNKTESNIFDHWVFGTNDGKIIFETSALSWKNLFSVDLYFEKGSLHINGLRKWGQSEFTQRKRIIPSGIPREKIYEDKGRDLTWKEDFDYFEKIVKLKQNSGQSDLQMSRALAIIALGSKNPIKNEQFRLFKEILKF